MKLSHSQSIAYSKSTRRKGFSLVEVIISIGIVALLLTGFLGVFGSAQKSINRSLGVKEANMLKDALETEMSTLRSTEFGTGAGQYTSSFHKAFEMIKNSNDRANAILVYQYKANPVDNDQDGILPAFDGDDGIQGKSYLTQIAVRKIGKDETIMEKELTSKTVVGNVYAVRMTQLLKDPATGNLELSTNQGQIFHNVGGTNVEAADHNAYDKAVITFQAEFFRLPSNSYGYVTSNNWELPTSGNKGGKGVLTKPVAVINMAIRR